MMNACERIAQAVSEERRTVAKDQEGKDVIIISLEDYVIMAAAAKSFVAVRGMFSKKKPE